MPYHTAHQREWVKQLLIEAQIQRFTTEETINFIHNKSGIQLGPDYIHKLKRIVKDGVSNRLKELQTHRTAYLAQFFQRIDEINKYMRELWTIYNNHPGDPNLQKSCLVELHQLTITQANLYEMLPQYTGSLVYAQEAAPTTNSREDQTAEAATAEATDIQQQRKF